MTWWNWIVWFASSAAGAYGGAKLYYWRRTRQLVRDAPHPPRNVVVTYADGTTQAMEMRYDGFDGDGIDLWTNTIPLTRQPVSMTCEEFPARTAISLRFARGFHPGVPE